MTLVRWRDEKGIAGAIEQMKLVLNDANCSLSLPKERAG
jgi:hypothetical protein